jgi:trans-2,3-dihydro-3-hydroxyanthranilate isomerase
MPEPRRFPYVVVDVFTARPLQGNPLAVFTDARGLSDPELQAVARETNLSETTFVFPDPAAPPGAPARARIFTVSEELPFAGHPTLGTATVLRGASGARRVTLALQVGEVPVDFEDGPDGAFGEMRQRDPELGRIHERDAVAAATGLSVDDLDPALPIQTVSTGLPFTIVPVRTLAALRALRLDGRAAAYLERSDGRFFYFVCQETVDPAARLHARMIFYGGEDPATGSAAGCCAAWMVAHGVARPDERVLIEQGIEARRPSRLFVRAGRAGDALRDVRVGGHAVEIARGVLTL